MNAIIYLPSGVGGTVFIPELLLEEEGSDDKGCSGMC